MNEDNRGGGDNTNSIGVVIHTGRSSRSIEEQPVG